jgi:hypothetical protein
MGAGGVAHQLGELAARRRAGERDEALRAGARKPDARDERPAGVGQARGGDGQVGEPGGRARGGGRRGGERLAEEPREAPGERRRAAHAHLLPEHGAACELEAVDAPRHAQPGPSRDERREPRIGAEVGGDRLGVGIEVEQAAQPGEQRDEHREERRRDVEPQRVRRRAPAAPGTAGATTTCPWHPSSDTLRA